MWIITTKLLTTLVQLESGKQDRLVERFEDGSRRQDTKERELPRVCNTIRSKVIDECRNGQFEGFILALKTVIVKLLMVLTKWALDRLSLNFHNGLLRQVELQLHKPRN